MVHGWIDGEKVINIYNAEGGLVESYPSPHMCQDSRNNPEQKDTSGYIVAVKTNRSMTNSGVTNRSVTNRGLTNSGVTNRNSQKDSSDELLAISCTYCGIYLFDRHAGLVTHSFQPQPLWVKTMPTTLCVGPDNTLISQSCYQYRHMLHVFTHNSDNAITLQVRKLIALLAY